MSPRTRDRNQTQPKGPPVEEIDLTIEGCEPGMGKKVSHMRRLESHHRHPMIVANICDGPGDWDPTGGWKPRPSSREWHELTAEEKKTRIKLWADNDCPDAPVFATCTAIDLLEVLAGGDSDDGCVPPVGRNARNVFASDGSGWSCLYKNVVDGECLDPTDGWMSDLGRKKWNELSADQKRKRILQWAALGRPPPGSTASTADDAELEAAIEVGTGENASINREEDEDKDEDEDEAANGNADADGEGATGEISHTNHEEYEDEYEEYEDECEVSSAEVEYGDGPADDMGLSDLNIGGSSDEEEEEDPAARRLFGGNDGDEEEVDSGTGDGHDMLALPSSVPTEAAGIDEMKAEQIRDEEAHIADL